MKSFQFLKDLLLNTEAWNCNICFKKRKKK